MNRLGDETSPYLLQHKDNPVHWWPWCDEAFEVAARERKPVLLSIGYAACHWCHVMAHESFENPETAELMNRLFVNIKVDREERPDVDHVYMSSLHSLGQHGGWPLTMFLDPNRKPFWGGTYFPPETRHGHPGFPDVLRAVSDTFFSDPARIRANAEAIEKSLSGLGAAQPGEAPDQEFLDAAATRIGEAIDPTRGGFFGAPKFPNCPSLDFLWRRKGRSDAGPASERVIATLNGMSEGGIYDHIGGGIARYSVDDRWLVPHFEKMLYDNAQYVRLLARVWRSEPEPLYRARMDETISWMLREMRMDGGGFASSLDADSEGTEGRYYVWSADQIDETLGTDAGVFREAYGISEQGNWEGSNIPNRLDAAPFDKKEDARLRPLRDVLLSRRDARVRPGFDDKVLADWNGLAIAALAEAGGSCDEENWVDAAEQAFWFIVSKMTEGGRFFHSWRDGRARHKGMLDDYVFMADASLALHDAGRTAGTLDHAIEWMEILDKHFSTGDGGYWRTADDGEALVARSRAGTDDATPAGGGVAAEVQARLWLLTGEDRWRESAEHIIGSFMGAVRRAPIAFPSVLSAADTLRSAVQVAIVPGGDGDGARTLARTARMDSPIGCVIRILEEGETFPLSPHNEKAKGAQAYVCRERSCSLPVHEPEQLRRLLANPHTSELAKTLENGSILS